MKKSNFCFYCHDTVAEIQSSFARYYPSLEIHFFSNNEKCQPDNAWVMLSPEVIISDISPESRDGLVELTDTMTIPELENAIQDCFKLHVEILPPLVKPYFAVSQIGHREMRPGNNRTTHPNIMAFKNVPFGC